MSKSLNVRQVYGVGYQRNYLQAVADTNSESKPETIEEYFGRSETPSRNSPTGNTMVRILAKCPEMSFEEARARANELLDRAAGARVFRGPIVRSAAELAKQKERLGQVFGRPSKPGTLAAPSIPGDSRHTVQKKSGSNGLREP